MDTNLKEVDLNLRHYIGDRSDVIKDVKVKIIHYLRNPEISDASRAIYSAIFNALTYYQNLSDLSISGETESKTFLENTLKNINEDYQYLSQKYNSTDPTAPKVIEIKGRIKSPVSAMDKILEKVSEYVKDGRDLSKLNESLRDFIGLRIIINPPPEIKAKGKQAESDFCYEIFNDLMERKGIIRQINGSEPHDTDFHFIPVNTEHHPNKLQEIMERPAKEGFGFDVHEAGLFIPESRPECVEQYSHFFKDYRSYPKFKGYQRLHACAHPFYSRFVPEEKIPRFVIPSKSRRPSIEYQICLADEEYNAEYGIAAHREYKDRDFHRLAIPLILFKDEKSDRIRLGRLDESMEYFYGFSFGDMFGIDYQTFLRIFDSQQRDDILAEKLKVSFDEANDEYLLTPSEKSLITSSEQTPIFLQNLLQSASEEELRSFFDANGISDGSVYTQNRPQNTKIHTPIRVYTVSHGSEIKKENSQEKKSYKISPKKKGPVTTPVTAKVIKKKSEPISNSPNIGDDDSDLSH